MVKEYFLNRTEFACLQTRIILLINFSISMFQILLAWDILVLSKSSSENKILLLILFIIFTFFSL